MTLTEVLLLALIASILYAAFVMRKRITQMNDFRASMETQRRDQRNSPDTSFQQSVNVLSVRPPINPSPNPQILELDRKIDKLYEDRDNGMRIDGRSWDAIEDELISKMVDIFIKDADTRLVSEGIRAQHSGSNP